VAVCRTVGIKRSTLIDSLARIGWLAGLHRRRGVADNGIFDAVYGRTGFQ
jgi:hypothetical protein